MSLLIKLNMYEVVGLFRKIIQNTKYSLYVYDYGWAPKQLYIKLFSSPQTWVWNIDNLKKHSQPFPPVFYVGALCLTRTSHVSSHHQ